MILSLQQVKGMTSNKVEIGYMIQKLKQWEKYFGNSQKDRKAGTEFDFLQEEFLTVRHQVEKNQDIKEREGITTKNAHIGSSIRDGIAKLKDILQKLKEQHRRLSKKKQNRDPQEILQRKLKIVENCELLLKDIQEREEGNSKPKGKAVTLTDLKAKLLKEIEDNVDKIHENGSDGLLSQHQDDGRQLDEWKNVDKKHDLMLQQITTNVKVVKDKVKNINKMQDIIMEKQKPIEKKIDKTTNRIKKDNDQLKEIIKKFKPNRCCLFFALFLLLVGLVVVIIKLLI